MSTFSYEIVKNNKFARRPGKPEGYICYRTIVCYIGMKMMLKTQDQNRFNELLVTMKNSINERKHHNDDDIELYYINEPGVLILVDRTHGTYPLVFYADPKVSPSSRIDALHSVLDDLLSKKELLGGFLFENSNKNFIDIQDKLQSYFTYPQED